MDHQQIDIEEDETILSYPNRLSRRQMDALTAVCDTLVASVDVSEFTSDDTLLNYYATSASMAGTPERLGGLVSSRLEHPKKWLMELALWALSTWYGTFVLCGMASLSTTFPYFHAFPNLPLLRREMILRKWSRSSFFLLRILYASAKFLTLLVFFTQVDEKKENQSWKAIGYSGPDPELKAQKKSKSEKDYGPLERGIVDLKGPAETVREKVSKVGIRTRSRPAGQQSSSGPYMSIECDVVVVGSGSGGAVVAGVLASAGHKVVVVEKGQYYARSKLTLLEGPSMDSMYLSGGLMASDDMQVVVLAGSTVGGGSTVNWSASIGTPEDVSEEWSSQCQLELFESKAYRDALECVCKRIGVQSEVAEEGLNNAVLRRGCHELGYPVTNIPRNAPPDHYCGWCCLGCRDGRKQGASETWLLDMVRSGNGIILPGCEAVRVLTTSSNTAAGVAFAFQLDGTGTREVCVVKSRVTVAACGALRTPTLLRASGLTNPNIGKNLHLHPVVMAWGHFPDEDKKKSYEGGIMTAMSSSPAHQGVIIQTPALHPGMFSALMPWLSSSDFKDRMRRFARTAHVLALARDDRSAGTVMSDNSIQYRLHHQDEEALQRGLERALRILAAAGAHEIGTHHRDGRTINVNKAGCRQVEAFIKEESRRAIRGHCRPICSAHQMGSCRMGVDPATSAVDPTGQTWEVQGLFVADTSVFPTALGVNPMVTVQAISYCTAHSILHLLARKKDKP